MKYRLKRCVLMPLAIALLVILDTTSLFAETPVEACDAGNMTKCEELVRLYGAGPSENTVKWRAYAEKACNLNSGGACNNLGVAWSKGPNEAFKIDLGKGSAYYKKACDLAHGIGCFNFANMHRLGEGVAVDLKLALENYNKACELGEAKGCTELGIMYYEGRIVPKNDVMTMAMFQKGCKLGSVTACKNIDILFPRPK
jgi:TPR repeat protein